VKEKVYEIFQGIKQKDKGEEILPEVQRHSQSRKDKFQLIGSKEVKKCRREITEENFPESRKGQVFSDRLF
jgi:hypothetical protein